MGLLSTIIDILCRYGIDMSCLTEDNIVVTNSKGRVICDKDNINGRIFINRYFDATLFDFTRMNDLIKELKQISDWVKHYREDFIFFLHSYLVKFDENNLKMVTEEYFSLNLLSDLANRYGFEIIGNDVYINNLDLVDIDEMVSKIEYVCDCKQRNDFIASIYSILVCSNIFDVRMVPVKYLHRNMARHAINKGLYHLVTHDLMNDICASDIIDEMLQNLANSQIIELICNGSLPSFFFNLGIENVCNIVEMPEFTIDVLNQMLRVYEKDIDYYLQMFALEIYWKKNENRDQIQIPEYMYKIIFDMGKNYCELSYHVIDIFLSASPEIHIKILLNDAKSTVKNGNIDDKLKRAEDMCRIFKIDPFVKNEIMNILSGTHRIKRAAN